MLEGEVQVGEICTGGQQVDVDFIVNGGGLDPAEGRYRSAVESAPIHHQEDGFVVDPAVEMNTTVVLRAFVVAGAGHLVGVVKGRRVTHAPDHTETRDIFSDLPLDAGCICTLSIGLIVILSPQV